MQKCTTEKLPAERTSFCNSPKRWPQKPRSSRDKIFFGVVPSTFLQWRLSVANWDAVLLPLLNTRTRARKRARPSHHANIRCDPFLAPARARESELHKPPPFNAQNSKHNDESRERTQQPAIDTCCLCGRVLFQKPI
jgi:hypothetical protein